MSTTVTTPAPAAPAMSSRAAEWGPVVVSVLALLLYLAAITVAWWTKDPSLGILLGVAATNATTAVSFWLGSSKGSSDKTAALVAAAGVPAAVLPPGATVTTTVPASTSTVTAPAAPAPGPTP